MKKTTLITLLAAALNTTAYCGIEWKQKEISLEVQRGQRSIEVSFPFTITGGESVAILSTKASSPGVTVNSAILGEHKSGTGGALKARYVPRGGSAGTRIEKITVQTTDTKTPEVELRLLVYAPLAYRIEPKNAFWNVGVEPDAKDLLFIDIAGKGCKPVAIYSTSTSLTTTLIPPEGKSSKYIIRIKPESTAEAGVAHVFLDIDMGDGTVEKRGIMVAIRDQNNPMAKKKLR